MDLFIVKKVVGSLLMPLPIIIVLLFLALGYLLRKKQRNGIITLSIATVLLLITALPTVPNALLYSLEHTYPQYDQSQQVDSIVVLGCGHVNDRTLPITSQLRPCSLIRATEALRIWQQNPDATIFTSGNVGPEPFSNACMVKKLLIELGVPNSHIRAIELSKDTKEEAQNLAVYLRNKPFALVSSASHLERAMTLFEQQGLNPIAAPTAHLVRTSDNPSLGFYAPQADNIQKLSRWWYEAMGRTWVWLSNL